MRPIEELNEFLRTERPDLEYKSMKEIDQEMDIADAQIEFDIDQRIITWIHVLLDPNATPELKSAAWRMIYLTGYIDHAAGVPL